MRRPALALGVAGLALVAAACGSPVAGSASPADDVPPVAAASAGVLDPAAVDIPAIGAHSSLKPSGVTPDGGWEVAPLSEPEQATWFEPGPEPGEPGTSVILGHVNGSHRPGVFARLYELKPGDEVRVTDTAGAVAVFHVTDVERQPKAEFASDEVLSDEGPAQLRLITCGGDLVHTATGGTYTDNWIVSAAL